MPSSANFPSFIFHPIPVVRLIIMKKEDVYFDPADICSTEPDIKDEIIEQVLIQAIPRAVKAIVV